MYMCMHVDVHVHACVCPWCVHVCTFCTNNCVNEQAYASHLLKIKQFLLAVAILVKIAAMCSAGGVENRFENGVKLTFYLYRPAPTKPEAELSLTALILHTHAVMITGLQ